MYELLYLLKYDSYVPYEADYGAAEYKVPKSDFEEVIQTYFQIDSVDIESNTVYYPDHKSFQHCLYCLRTPVGSLC